MIHTHSCENDRACEKIIRQNHSPKVFVSDVSDRCIDDIPYCDVFTFTAPCQSYSTAGQKRGWADARGSIMQHSLDFIKARKPACVLSENVASLATQHKQVLEYLLTFFTSEGYTAHWRILSTDEFGIPQHRRRFYLMAFRQQRTNACGIDLWPAPHPVCLDLQQLVKPVPRSVWRFTPVDDTGKGHVMAAYAGAFEQGLNPFVTPIVVDIGCSPTWRVWKVNPFGTFGY